MSRFAVAAEGTGPASASVRKYAAVSASAISAGPEIVPPARISSLRNGIRSVMSCSPSAAIVENRRQSGKYWSISASISAIVMRGMAPMFARSLQRCLFALAVGLDQRIQHEQLVRLVLGQLLDVT